MKNQTIRDCSLLLLIVTSIYLPSLGIQEWDGNETLRVIIAQEMLKTGNWIMPTLHGKLYFAKPPLMNWLIAASGSIFGSINEWTSRLPSVLMTLLTALSVYILSAKWLGREARLFAGAMVLSMTGLLRMGRMAEIESLNIWFISFILLLWINGYERKWKPHILWGLTLTVAGVGFLSKGPQILIFLYVTIVPYLLIKKRMSFFFSRAHAFGLSLLLCVLGIYLAGILHWTTLENYLGMWMGEGVARTDSGNFLLYLRHIVDYPPQLLLYFMPSLLFLLPLFIDRGLRREIQEALKNEIFLFSLVVLAANFPIYWLLPNMRYKYFLPAAPFVALSCAVIFDIYLMRIETVTLPLAIIRIYAGIMALMTIAISAIILPALYLLRFTVPFSTLFPLACAFVIAAWIIYNFRSLGLLHSSVAVAVMAAALTVFSVDVSAVYKTVNSNSPKEIAREINLVLPQDIDTVYEIGYKRFLPVTCYLQKNVIQIESFSELPELKKKGRVCFIFDTAFFNDANAAAKDVLREMRWEKIYSREYKKEKRDIVVGISS